MVKLPADLFQLLDNGHLPRAHGGMATVKEVLVVVLNRIWDAGNKGKMQRLEKYKWKGTLFIIWRQSGARLIMGDTKMHPQENEKACFKTKRKYPGLKGRGSPFPPHASVIE